MIIGLSYSVVGGQKIPADAVLVGRIGLGSARLGRKPAAQAPEQSPRPWATTITAASP
jgi:hypothetical protein